MVFIAEVESIQEVEFIPELPKCDPKCSDLKVCASVNRCICKPGYGSRFSDIAKKNICQVNIAEYEHPMTPCLSTLDQMFYGDSARSRLITASLGNEGRIQDSVLNKKRK